MREQSANIKTDAIFSNSFLSSSPRKAQGPVPPKVFTRFFSRKDMWDNRYAPLFLLALHCLPLARFVKFLVLKGKNESESKREKMKDEVVLWLWRGRTLPN